MRKNKIIPRAIVILFFVVSSVLAAINPKAINANEAYMKKAEVDAKKIDFGKDRIIAILDTGINQKCSQKNSRNN